MKEGFSMLGGPQGLRLGHETIDLLGTHDLPTTPPNYEIWITHRTGAHPELSREIEARLARGQPFTHEVIDDLFERYFANTRLSVQVAEASETISRELVEAVATLRDASEQSGCYADTLDVAASTLEGGLDAARFRALVAKLASVTRDIAQKNHALSEQMAASSRQVEALQATLQSVKVQALTDGLTGLANRKYFDETLRRRVTESDAGAGELCLLMCDIDQFKAFNDSWGHLVGDQVIRFIAGALNVHAGGDFLAARYGGDEFALVMPRTTLEEARNVGAAILNAVRAKRLTRRSTGAAIGSITLSIGIAERKTGETPRSLIGRADACLYASKRGGRNRSTTDAELDQPFAA